MMNELRLRPDLAKAAVFRYIGVLDLAIMALVRFLPDARDLLLCNVTSFERLLGCVIPLPLSSGV